MGLWGKESEQYCTMMWCNLMKKNNKMLLQDILYFLSIIIFYYYNNICRYDKNVFNSSTICLKKLFLG